MAKCFDYWLDNQQKNSNLTNTFLIDNVNWIYQWLNTYGFPSFQSLSYVKEEGVLMLNKKELVNPLKDYNSREIWLFVTEVAFYNISKLRASKNEYENQP